LDHATLDQPTVTLMDSNTIEVVVLEDEEWFSIRVDWQRIVQMGFLQPFIKVHNKSSGSIYYGGIAHGNLWLTYGHGSQNRDPTQDQKGKYKS